MKVYPPYHTLPHRPHRNHVRFARPPSTVFGETRSASDKRDDVYAAVPRLFDPSLPIPEEDISDCELDDGMSDVSSLAHEDPLACDMPAFPDATRPALEAKDTAAPWAWSARVTSAFDIFVERIEVGIEALRASINSAADELVGNVAAVHATITGTVNALCAAVQVSLENMRFRVHGFLGRKV